MPPPGSVDVSNILSVCRIDGAIDRALLQEMFGHFIDENRQRIAAAAAAVDANDRDALQQLSHTIRGSAAILGASHLQDLAGSIEHVAATADLTDLRKAVVAMAQEFCRVLTTLRKAHPEAWAR